MEDEELDLTARLAQAIASYEAGWKPVDSELYDLCGRRSSQDDFADVYTKVAIIGRVYEAGVARAWRDPARPRDRGHTRPDRACGSRPERFAAP